MMRVTSDETGESGKKCSCIRFYNPPELEEH
jgi:hypothetical protein